MRWCSCKPWCILVWTRGDLWSILLLNDVIWCTTCHLWLILPWFYHAPVIISNGVSICITAATLLLHGSAYWMYSGPNWVSVSSCFLTLSCTFMLLVPSLVSMLWSSTWWICIWVCTAQLHRCTCMFQSRVDWPVCYLCEMSLLSFSAHTPVSEMTYGLPIRLVAMAR
jgi:hypothetical protein